MISFAKLAEDCVIKCPSHLLRIFKKKYLTRNKLAPCHLLQATDKVFLEGALAPTDPTLPPQKYFETARFLVS